MKKKSSILSRKWENCLIELDQNSNMTKLDWIWLNLIKLDQNLIELESLSLYEYECNIYSRQWKNINIEQEMGKLFAFHIWCKIATVNKHSNLICYAQMSTNNARKGNWHGSRSWSNITCHIIMHFIAKIFMELQFTFLKFQWFHRTVW